MRIITEINSIADFDAWSGGKYTLDKIVDLGYPYTDALDELAEEIFPEGCTETELNDWLWFDDEFIFESLGLDEDGNIPEDEEDEEDEEEEDEEEF